MRISHHPCSSCKGMKHPDLVPSHCGVSKSFVRCDSLCSVGPWSPQVISWKKWKGPTSGEYTAQVSSVFLNLLECCMCFLAALQSLWTLSLVIFFNKLSQNTIQMLFFTFQTLLSSLQGQAVSVTLQGQRLAHLR